MCPLLQWVLLQNPIAQYPPGNNGDHTHPWYTIALMYYLIEIIFKKYHPLGSGGDAHLSHSFTLLSHSFTHSVTMYYVQKNKNKIKMCRNNSSHLPGFNSVKEVGRMYAQAILVRSAPIQQRNKIRKPSW